MTRKSIVYYNARKRARFYRVFYSKLLTSLIIIFLIAIINVIISPNNLWVIWVIFGFASLFLITYLKYLIKFKYFNNNWEKRFIEKDMNKYYKDE